MLTHLRAQADAVSLLVLGARGFVARAFVAHAVSLGWKVRAVGSMAINLIAPNSVDAVAALLSPEDTLVMVSALTPDRGQDIATLMRNLAMGQHVCAALEKQPCGQVINVGSDALYDESANPVREMTAVAPASLHGLMHFTREQMLADTCRRLRVPLARLRPSLLYGPGDTHNGYGPNRFVRTAVADGRIKLFGEGEEQRDHVFIGDVARVIAEVVHRRSEGVLNVATGRSHSFRHVADLVATTVDRDVAVEPSSRVNAIVHRHFDVTALIRAFPNFQFTSLDDGLSRTIASVS